MEINRLKSNLRKKSNEEFEQEFEILWKLYPRKLGKATALKSYIKARKRNTTFEEVKAGIEHYIAYIIYHNIEPQFIKQCSTWFAGERWTDEYEELKKNKLDELHEKAFQAKQEKDFYKFVCIAEEIAKHERKH